MENKNVPVEKNFVPVENKNVPVDFINYPLKKNFYPMENNFHPLTFSYHHPRMLIQVVRVVAGPDAPVSPVPVATPWKSKKFLEEDLTLF